VDGTKWCRTLANAYRVQATSFEEMGAPRGVIEKVLWRIARKIPDGAHDRFHAEGPRPEKPAEEVRKQLKFSSRSLRAQQNFDKSRHAWIASASRKTRPTGQRL